MTSTTPITRTQRYDHLGGCSGIDEEFGLPACTSSDLLGSKEFSRIARKFREGYCRYRYGREDGIIHLPFDEADRQFARELWAARPDVQDLFLHARPKMREDWGLGERLGRALLQVQLRLPLVRSGGAIVRLPLESLERKQRGEWLMVLFEYEVHLHQRTRS